MQSGLNANNVIRPVDTSPVGSIGSLVVGPDLGNVYSSKTDDELLSLAADRASLEPEAQTALWAELKRRKMTDPHLWQNAAPDEVPFRAQNPAFNTPAKIAYGVLFVCFAAIGIRVLIEMDSREFLKFVLAFILLWGPIFAVIAWATRRALRGRPKHEKDS